LSIVRISVRPTAFALPQAQASKTQAALTRRAEVAEAAVLELVAALSRAPDPLPLLQSSASLSAALMSEQTKF
jgi:hypothetical protein